MASPPETTDRIERDLFALDEAFESRPGLRDAILETVGSRAPYAGFARRLCRFLDLGEARVRELLASAVTVDREPWHASHLSGVRFLHFEGGPNIAEAHAGLVHIEPGVHYPVHTHRGDEWTFVLRGSAREDNGRVSQAGDLVHSPAGSRHSFQVLGSEPYLFVAVIYDGIDFDPPTE